MPQHAFAWIRLRTGLPVRGLIMIIDPINIADILSVLVWPIFGWLTVKTICKAVSTEGAQQLERIKLKQQHELVCSMNKEST